MRATRARLRRRMQRARKRAELLAHVHTTNSQDNLPAIGQTIASKAHRDGVAERCAAPAVQTRSAVALALISDDDALLREVDLTLLKTAQHHDATTLSLLQPVPGLGKILSFGLRYAIHDINRFPTVQDLVSDGRLVTCAKESAGQRWGTSGTKIGHAHLTWAFSEAAVWVLRDPPLAQQDLARLAKKPDNGKALTVLAHTWARAVYDRRKRHVAFDQKQCFHRSWRGAEEPGASLDPLGEEPARRTRHGCLPGVMARPGA